MRISLTLLFVLICLALQAQVIPPGNRVNWDSAGCRFPFPEPERVASVTDFGAHGNGTEDDVFAFRDALASLGGRYGVVVIPAGTYLLLSPLELPDSVILRGAGADSTFLKFSHDGAGLSVSGTASNTYSPLAGGLLKGSERVTVANPSLFTAGDFVEIRQENGSWDTKPADWAEYSVGQINRVTDVTGDTLILEEPLRITFDPALNPEVQRIVPAHCISTECMNLERVSSSTEGTGNNLYVNLASDCRVKGVESNKSQGSHCRISLSTHVSVTGSYFHHAFVYDGTGTKGYGVTLIQHAGMCLVTNNIFRILRHAMMTKQGANGNVFGYNYSREVYRTEFPQNFGGDISLHGHYSFANLFEGNIVQTIHVDDYWGPSGPCNTFFRNRAELYGILMTTSGTDTSNFAGNEILNVYPYGNYTITGNGNFLYGNNRNGSIQPPGTDTLPDSSYHFKSIPPFWNITDAWPGIGPPNALNSHSIPAKARYLSGRFTDCSGGSLVPVNRRLPDELRVYPDPAGEFLFVDLPGTGPYCMDIFSSSGQHILYRKLRDDTYVGISSLSPGLYIVRVQQGVRIMARKFLMP